MRQLERGGPRPAVPRRGHSRGVLPHQRLAPLRLAEAGVPHRVRKQAPGLPRPGRRGRLLQRARPQAEAAPPLVPVAAGAGQGRGHRRGVRGDVDAVANSAAQVDAAKPPVGEQAAVSGPAPLPPRPGDRRGASCAREPRHGRRDRVPRGGGAAAPEGRATSRRGGDDPAVAAPSRGRGEGRRGEGRGRRRPRRRPIHAHRARAGPRPHRRRTRGQAARVRQGAVRGSPHSAVAAGRGGRGGQHAGGRGRRGRGGARSPGQGQHGQGAWRHRRRGQPDP
mmetsp:Transcript_26616/g.100162  ORF Transcript_26616/g.100162 Transcript_26616/m.100162 type:complete len:279 (+) Transcript_26616:283-1119(+)